mmetsp:Transcript_42877/g.99384  ORF Transcript_42877/g.99384 Transcript_42877/m.99384 type:complete len:209 (-) Transcript_42877:7-633(-)
MRLLVDGECCPLVRALQVDRKIRQNHQGLRDADQLLCQARRSGNVLFRLAHHHLPRQAERAVEPRVPQAAAVALDADLQHPRARHLGVGPQPQARRVRVRPHDGHPGLRPRLKELASDHEGHHLGAALGDEVLAAPRQGPRLPVRQLDEAARLQHLRAGQDGVVGRPRLIDEVHKVLGGLHGGAASHGRAACAPPRDVFRGVSRSGAG